MHGYSSTAELGNLLNIPPVSIEILPGDGSEWLSQLHDGHHPFLFVEQHLGVPQKVLYAAYLESIPWFLQSCKGIIQDGSKSVTDAAIDGLRQSSAIVLLGNPAHQTALNARKRLVQRSAIDPRHELRFTASLLTIRDASKQSILWHHRRWLLRLIHRPTVSEDALPVVENQSDTMCDLTIDPEAFLTEFSITSQACETYPRNYHAWAHRFSCLEALVALAHRPASTLYEEILSDEITATQRWIDTHVSDYTAVQYLCRAQTCLLNASARASGSGVIPCSPPIPSSAHDPAALLAHAKSLVRSYPEHETLWLYLRGALSVPVVSSVQRGATAQMREFVRELLRTDLQHELSVSLADPKTVHRHACRFLVWLARQNDTALDHAALVKRLIADDWDNDDILKLLDGRLSHIV
ncbi:Protein prenyltransferase alpha subunit repeat-containing protein 1 [Grifola frondosa]|uniref:Protein prenyltransferase alpha subunit repeat-containing protein 1 n=1 Tax=Grifola frondosa TaxID=5627 RepID=A0A1C7LZN5_GRIFR|nr:Protein prenyltransferase alpha subunit repeat-containing protein 1 [Grifola frondosa]